MKRRLSGRGRPATSTPVADADEVGGTGRRVGSVRRGALGKQIQTQVDVPRIGSETLAIALIIEDHADQADMLARLLRLHHYEAHIASTGEEGLRMVREYLPDVVLLDLMLPDINGFEVCKHLRADTRTMLTPVVIVTALSDADHRRNGFRVGANAYLTKPYGIPDLLKALETARLWIEQMQRRSLQAEIQVELDSEIALLQELNDLLLHVCRKSPMNEEQVLQLRQAVMEMAHNAIEWGNRNDAGRVVRVTYRLHQDRVEIVVRDEGAGFNPANLPHAARPGDPITHLDVRDRLGLRAGGFGMMISRGMVDELRYNEVGNEVTLVKRFHPL